MFMKRRSDSSESPSSYNRCPASLPSADGHDGIPLFLMHSPHLPSRRTRRTSRAAGRARTELLVLRLAPLPNSLLYTVRYCFPRARADPLRFWCYGVQGNQSEPVLFGTLHVFHTGRWMTVHPWLMAPSSRASDLGLVCTWSSDLRQVVVRLVETGRDQNTLPQCA